MFFFLKVVARLTISFNFLAFGTKSLLIPYLDSDIRRFASTRDSILFATLRLLDTDRIIRIIYLFT